MTLLNRIKFTRDALSVALYQGVFELPQNLKAMVVPAKGASLKSKLVRFAAVGAAATPLALMGGAQAYAASCANTTTNANGVITLLQNVGMLMIVLGGVGALITFGAGALMIMWSGGNHGRAQKGMTMVKNTIIGLAVLAGGLFLRTVITQFVNGSTAAVAGNPNDASDVASCLNGSKFGS